MKQLLLIVVLIASFGISANAQIRNSDLTWNELKQVQTQERTLLENRQKEELAELKEMYKMEINEVRGNTGPVLRVSEKFSQKRMELAQIHAEERSKLTQTHAEERKVFLQNRSPK